MEYTGNSRKISNEQWFEEMRIAVKCSDISEAEKEEYVAEILSAQNWVILCRRQA